MKRTFISLVAMLVVMAAMATPVSKQTTLSIANSFFTEMGGSGSLAEVQTQFSNLHIYAVTDGVGFVIMSSDNAAMPLLGYSVNSTFDAENIPANAAAWLQSYDDQIAYIQQHRLEASAEIRDAWGHLGNMQQSQRMPASTSTFDTDNLLTTIWNQTTLYNNMCPYDQDADNRVPTGCVATAMGQIMKYWNFPQYGVGSYSYEHFKYGTQSADFSTANYDWADMPDALDSYSTSTQVSAVSQLLYHCGVAVETQYAPTSSTADDTSDGTLGYPCAENAYRQYFKYMHTLHTIVRSNYNDSAWCALLKNEIDNGRPVHYGSDDISAIGESHSFVCCGYDNFGLFYFNWGWGGSSDGYFAMDNLNPASHQFQINNEAIIGICPDTTGSATTVISFARNIQDAGTETGAGTYTSYQDTVQIVATAAAGYIFENWNGSMTYNPYRFIANGGNVTHTANYSLLTGDSLGYCHDEEIGAFGDATPKTNYWGIRLDTLSLTPDRGLQRVKFLSHKAGEYIIHIYEGGENKPVSELRTDTVNSTYLNEWISVTLASPVKVDEHKSLWIVLETSNIDSPMVYSAYRGNIDGAWYTENPQGTWSNYVTDQSEYVAWMIEGIFAEYTGPYTVTVSANNDSWGTVTGGGEYMQGDSVTLTATANQGYEFVQWDDGDNNSTRTIVVTDDCSYVAYFQAASAVDNVEQSSYLVAAGNGMITVQGANGETIRLFDATGKVISQRDNTSYTELFNVIPGVYIVQIASQTTTVVVNR